jgi:FkbM family methyltransferase
MKKLLQASLQRLLGFERYLFWFSCFKIQTLRWDRKEGDFNYFLSMLPEDARVLDIGANIGIMTGLLARNCPRGHIHAFEPIPENLRALRRILRFFRLHNVSLHSVALGSTRKQVEMLMPIMQGVQMQGLSHVDHQSIEGFEGRHHRYQVEQVPLDELDFWKKEKVDAIKIDVENYEQFVLEGGKELLETYHPLIYAELWDNENRSRCFSLLRQLGYQVQVLEKGELCPFSPDLHAHQNFFFTYA